MSEQRRKFRVRILWTHTAKECLRNLPKKVQRGLVDKAEELAGATDPRSVHKPLTGLLSGYYRLTYARYRAVYRVDDEDLANGNTLRTVTITFVACGKREERSKDDIYKVAQKLVQLGLIDVPDESKGGKPPHRGHKGG